MQPPFYGSPRCCSPAGACSPKLQSPTWRPEKNSPEVQRPPLFFLRGCALGRTPVQPPRHRRISLVGRWPFIGEAKVIEILGGGRYRLERLEGTPFPRKTAAAVGRNTFG